MARKVALINMKGGVGKSTLAANLAWEMARAPWRNDVLVIDVDPQFNCSQYLVGPNRMEQVIENGNPTVQDIFAVPRQSARRPNLSRAILNVRGHYLRQGVIDLIPSRLELSQTLRDPAGKEHLLKRAVDRIEDRYDLVIVDCPPTESVLTTAAYLVADYILVPVRPQFLATIGLPLLEKSLAEFENEYPGEAPEILGLAFNAVRPITYRSTQESLQMDRVRRVAREKKWTIFDEEVVYSDSFPRGSSEGTPIFLTDYARDLVKHNFRNFAREFARRIGL